MQLNNLNSEIISLPPFMKDNVHGRVWVWKYFKEYPKEHPRAATSVVCAICYAEHIKNHSQEQSLSQSEVAIGTKRSTSHLRVHMSRNHRALAEVENQQENAQIVGKKRKEPNEELSLIDCYIKLIAEKCLPISLCEDGTFREFLEIVRAHPDCLSNLDSQDVVLRIEQLALNGRSILKEKLRGLYFAISCNHWISHAFENYIIVTVHFVKNFALKSHILCCKPHQRGSQSEILVNELIAIFRDDYDVTNFQKYCICVVSDSAPNMTKFGRHLREDVGIPWHGCIRHTFDVTVGEIYEGNNFSDDSKHVISWCRHVVEVDSYPCFSS